MNKDVHKVLSADLEQLDLLCRQLVGSLHRHGLLSREDLFDLASHCGLSLGTLSAVLSLAEFTCKQGDAEEQLLELLLAESAGSSIDDCGPPIVVVVSRYEVAVVVRDEVVWLGERNTDAQKAVLELTDGLSKAHKTTVVHVHCESSNTSSPDWIQVAKEARDGRQVFDEK